MLSYNGSWKPESQEKGNTHRGPDWAEADTLLAVFECLPVLHQAVCAGTKDLEAGSCTAGLDTWQMHGIVVAGGRRWAGAAHCFPCSAARVCCSQLSWPHHQHCLKVCSSRFQPGRDLLHAGTCGGDGQWKTGGEAASLEKPFPHPL